MLTQAQTFLVDVAGRAVPDAIDPCDPGRALTAAAAAGRPRRHRQPGAGGQARGAGRRRDRPPVTVDRQRLAELHTRERARFRAEHPRSRRLAEAADRHLLAGVPMAWMRRWPGDHPLFVAEAVQGRFRDVDGHEYVDLCLGDTGAMGGHAHPGA